MEAQPQPSIPYPLSLKTWLFIVLLITIIGPACTIIQLNHQFSTCEVELNRTQTALAVTNANFSITITLYEDLQRRMGGQSFLVIC